MALVCNGTPVKKVICNGVEVKKVFIGDEQVFVNWDGSVLGNLDMFPEDVWEVQAIDGATIPSTTIPHLFQPLYYEQMQLYTSYTMRCKLTAYIEVDLTFCKSLYVRGAVKMSSPSSTSSLGSCKGGVHIMSNKPSSTWNDSSYNLYTGDGFVSSADESTNNVSDVFEKVIDVSDKVGIYYLVLTLYSSGGYAARKGIYIDELYFDML